MTQHLWRGYHPHTMLSRADITTSFIIPYLGSQFSYLPLYIEMWTFILMGTSPFSVFDLKKYIVEIEHGLRRKADKRFEVTMTVKQVS